ncbi:GvpL/GvpF family gas vesicle protein [Egicoccus halophilus]|uniref:Gas vesicle protein n=1 Tax=Egicoccus halophilus TaxID=1670830 RepID=A0A8J3A7J2_9ACTN|nr:GvpL/GvpF family gas vesicle protein [Egicoccus halophilus]GGI03839.1 gas vesicle protein [Egicoccus halophilus]
MTLLVHGVVADHSVDTSAMGDIADVYTVSAGGIAALVSDVRDEPVLPSRAMMLRHANVLEAAAATTTVVPMRFGVAVPSRDALRDEFLHPAQAQLTEALSYLRGRSEWRLRGDYVENEAIRAVLANDRRAASLRGRRDTDAKMELGERIVQGVSGLRDRDTPEVLGHLREHVVELVSRDVTEPLACLDASLLVDDEGQEALERHVEQLAERFAPRLQLRLVGPLPPYSFAAMETTR